MKNICIIVCQFTDDKFAGVKCSMCRDIKQRQHLTESTKCAEQILIEGVWLGDVT